MLRFTIALNESGFIFVVHEQLTGKNVFNLKVVHSGIVHRLLAE